MECGLPLFLIQHTLRTLCCRPDSSISSKWVYAIFWRILPRNFPPPKWEFGGSPLDRFKGNKRNWILAWEDGFCDFQECGYSRGRFGADLFFKLSHEVYNYGEGLVGKVAASNGHKWVFRDNPNESDPCFISSWNSSVDPQPRAWESQFKSGIQTIAVIAVREGIIQLGSFHRVLEDANLVVNVQRKFSYLQSIPGLFPVQRPHLPSFHPFLLKPAQMTQPHGRQSTGVKRLFSDIIDDNAPIKCFNFGWNSPQISRAVVQIPSLLPSTSCSLGTVIAQDASDAALLVENNDNNCPSQMVRMTQCTGVKLDASQAAEEEQCAPINPSRVVQLGFGLVREDETKQSTLTLH